MSASQDSNKTPQSNQQSNGAISPSLPNFFLPRPHDKQQRLITYPSQNARPSNSNQTPSQCQTSQSHPPEHRSPETVEINPNTIRFSQDTVNNPKRIAEIENSMRTNGWYGDPIDVVRMPDGKLTSVDNRRVLVARRVAMKVKARIHDHKEPLRNNSDRKRFTTKSLPSSPPDNWGDTVKLRVLDQKSFIMRNTEPYGTFDEPYVTGPNTSKRVNKQDYDLPEEVAKESKKATSEQSKKTKAKGKTTRTTKQTTTANDHTSQNSHMKSKPCEMETDHTSFREHNNTARPKPETTKSRTQKKQISTALVKYSSNSRTSQTYKRLRIHREKSAMLKTVPPVHVTPELVGAGQWTITKTKLGGVIKTTSKHQRIVVNGPTNKFMHERRLRIHENPLYKKQTHTQEGKNHLDPSQNYKRVKSKYSPGPGIKAAKNGAKNAAIDTVVYALLATDKARPSLAEAATTVATAAGTAFVNSVIPGGRLLTTLGTAIATQNYENLPVDLAFAATSLIPGNPIHLERQHTQANAPLFGNDLRSDEVNRVSADLSLPYLSDLASVGLCYDREKIEFSRNGVTTNRDATAVSVHASFGSALDASLGFSSGTETSEAVMKNTADGMTETTQWEKQFSGQLGARVRAADRKAAWDIGLAFNEVTTTTTTKTKTDQTATSVRENLSLRHLQKQEDRFQRNSETIWHMHENYVNHESAALPSDGRVEIIYAENTIVTDSKEAYGLWKTSHKTEKYDLYQAEEDTVHRFDQEVLNEIETTLTHHHVELAGRDLRESREQTTDLVFFASDTNERKYQPEEKRDKEVVLSESTDKTKIISKKDRTAYDVRLSESAAGSSTVTEIEKDYSKRIRHFGTSNETVSTFGQKETIRTKRNVEGFLQPEVKTSVHEVQQVFERTNEHTELHDPHLQTTSDVTQTYGLLTNKTEVSVKTWTKDQDAAEEKNFEVVETLGGAAHSALSSITSNVLQMACDPAARTTRNVRNAFIDVGMQGTVGWSHSNVAARQNSPGSAAIATVVIAATNTVTKICSSNSETLSTREVLTDVALSSASPLVSVTVNVPANIPTPLKSYAAIITNLIIRTGQTAKAYRENRVTLGEAKAVILQEITSTITNCSIQMYLVPELVSLLPLGSLGASVVACIAGAALSFAAFKVISWVKNNRQEGRDKEEYENLCKELEVKSTAKDAEIDSRYRRLALQVHPDKVGGDATRFKKLTQDFERLHQLRSRCDIQPDKTQTSNILRLLREFLADPKAFFRYLSQAMTSTADPLVPESPLMLTS